MYKLCSVGDRTESCDTSDCILVYLRVDISPSTDNLNFRFLRNELINLITLIGNFNVDNL
jgi:hypothetical protein